MDVRDPSAKLPRPAFLLPRERVQNSSFRELPRNNCFYDFSRNASAVTRGASAKAFCTCCMEICCLYLLVGRALWDNVFGCLLLFDRRVCSASRLFPAEACLLIIRIRGRRAGRGRRRFFCMFEMLELATFFGSVLAELPCFVRHFLLNGASWGYINRRFACFLCHEFAGDVCHISRPWAIRFPGPGLIIVSSTPWYIFSCFCFLKVTWLDRSAC